MLWLLLILLLFITPLQLRLTLRHTQGIAGLLTLRCWGFQHDIPFRIVHTPQGRQLILSGKPPRPLQPRSDDIHSSLVMLGTLLRSNSARAFLLHHLELQELTVSIRLCLDNAARTAMLTGCFRSVYSLLPPLWRQRMRVHILPDFRLTSSAAHLRCILFTRLGTLVITAAMLLIAWMLERREHRSDRPKEETS